MSSGFEDKYKQHPTSDLENWNTDRDVTPFQMTRGMKLKTSAGSWVYALGDSTGALIANTAAAFVDVDTVFTNVTSGGTVYSIEEYYGGTTMTTQFGYDANNNVSAISTSVA